MNDPDKTGLYHPGGGDNTGGDPCSPVIPTHIGRYRVEKILGQGGFGLVYLAHDEQLQRLVAIKVPHAKLVAQARDAEAYLTEARTVANLDHPNIVPVHDIGSTEQFPCFVVSKYVDGASLATRVKQSRLAQFECVELAATVAEALHYAHAQGLVHRDIKPGNVLLDKCGKPYIADFGLALREQDMGKGPHFAGTPEYMSPEQARGEGHRVDGRSDIFSLGVVLFEMLTGRRPFQGESTAEVLEQIKTIEPRPLRQWDDSIPRELERICIKALSKRAADRYSTARDLANDLRHWASGVGADPGAREINARSAEAELAVMPGTGKEVFLSHASPDKEIAWRLCRLLEEKGISCWIAPRDVTPGADYAEAILRAIEGTTTTILLLSTHANASIHVTHEVERATSKRKRVIPVRLEDVRPGASLELHLATAHWLDGWRLSPEQLAAQLALALRGEASAPSDHRPLKIVPKGLRSFDAHDADFFLELMPGPRDRDGLPDSIRFWKTRIEETDAECTFSVGLIYGPSGCGKSSVVKAGLLPRLSGNVIAVYVECTADETETRILNGLRRKSAALPKNVDLKEVLASLRRGQGIPAGKKMLIVLDQFEQWLNAKKKQETADLVQALRQCDGGRVQSIVMVRDDFWMATTRFMNELEIRLLEGQNSAAVDLFPIRHAEKVLAAFGRAFNILPDVVREISKGQKEFLTQAVSGLAQEGKVICVRLALFAEMMQGKAWTSASLKEVGGAEGVGVAFLEETFSSATAPPEHRYHQKAARATLKALLPDSGADIKGHMLPRTALLEASGYSNRPQDFENLIRILDSQIRLITPTDPEGKELEDSSSRIQAGVKYYQLTHDYLVPSLRDWLTRKQKETRRGRAELLLADRAAVWNARPDNRQLPSLTQWLQIRWLTAKKNWTPPQRKMIQRAERYHGLRLGIAATVLVILWLTALGIRDAVIEKQNATRAELLVDGLLTADISQLPVQVKSLAAYRHWTDPQLKNEYERAKPGSAQKLHASLALLPVDAAQVEYLRDQLLVVTPQQFAIVRDALTPYTAMVVEPLWSVALDSKRKIQPRFQAACALATYAPRDIRWKGAGPLVADHLVKFQASDYLAWRNALLPAKEQLLAPLTSIYESKRAGQEQNATYATEALAEYAADNTPVLAELLMKADDKQFAVIYPKFQERHEQGLPLLTAEIDRRPLPDASDDAKEALAKRQANAAVALLRLNRPRDVWPLLRHSPEPRVRSWLIHRLGPFGADAAALIHRLDAEPDITVRRALLLSLGEFDDDSLPSDKRNALLAQLQKIYRTDADPGLHAAAEWLIGTWKQKAWLTQVNGDWAKDKARRQTRLDGLKPSAAQNKAQALWYVNDQGQTMVIVPGPADFIMGSPESEAGRFDNEVMHRTRIGRSFAIGAKLVTVAQFLCFDKGHHLNDIRQYAPDPDCPVLGTSWYQAAAYCNWLSKEEGIPNMEWCYEPNAAGKYEAGMKPAPNYLERRGYRLPTEAEWEYACRAGSMTSRYYGAAEEMLGKYGWYAKNSDNRSWPVGSLMPNDLGLFDMHGNAYAWCHDSYAPYRITQSSKTMEDDGDMSPADEKIGRVLRGGGFLLPGNLRSAFRYWYQPGSRNFSVGFRPARTCP